MKKSLFPQVEKGHKNALKTAFAALWCESLGFGLRRSRVWPCGILNVGCFGCTSTQHRSKRNERSRIRTLSRKVKPCAPLHIPQPSTCIYHKTEVYVFGLSLHCSDVIECQGCRFVGLGVESHGFGTPFRAEGNERVPRSESLVHFEDNS